MTANMAVSSSFPSLPRRAVMASFSSSVRPRVRWRGSATPAVSSTPPTLPGPTGAPEDAKSGGKPAHLQVLTRPPACNNGSMTVVENEATESRTPMSQEHKEALAAGREQSRAVKRYLEALDANRPRRGRKKTKESIQKQLDGIEAKLANADPLTRLNLLQERIDLQGELNSTGETV